MSGYHSINGRWFVEERGLLVPWKPPGMSPAQRLGYEPCPTCGGRRTRSDNSRALNGPITCADAFHKEADGG